MPTRRRFIGAAVAAVACPALGWAAAGAPSHLSAARAGDGSYHLLGLRSDGEIAFRLGLPERGHAAAAHPHKAQAVAFARRPGTFALVLDCTHGGLQQTLQTPVGRHFYGHGAFSRDGQLLLTTENDIATGAGIIGLWRAGETYQRVGEITSNGIGPHEIVRLPGTDHFAVANGGIRTHPKTGREKLNLDSMKPNLTILDASGTFLDMAELPDEWHKNSLRHISAFKDGRIACAFQWQGDPYAAPSIAGLYALGAGLRLIDMKAQVLHRLDGYAGSIAALGSDHIGVTFPRGDLAQVIDLKSHRTVLLRRGDVCGIARGSHQTLVTDGFGGVHHFKNGKFETLARHGVSFDNHLVAVS